MMREVLLSVLLAATVSDGCTFNQSTGETTSIALDGSIDESNAEKLSEEITRHPKNTVVLTVRSTGGDSIAAMDLGDTMLEFGVSMVIQQYCQSACSQYLMPSASSVVIQNSASVAFHGTPSWLISADSAPQPLQQFFRNFRTRERDFLTARGIDYQAWLWVQHHKVPLCWFENTSADAASVDRYAVASRFHFVAPSREVFEQLGFQNMQGDLPNSAKQAWEFATQNGFREAIAVSYVPRIAINTDWSPAPLNECDDETRALAGY